MSFAKNLWTDLVEKHLWPVALVLLLALVAVPVALGGGSDDAAVSVPPGATGSTGASALTAQVALEQTSPVRRDRAGKERDPFKQPKVAGSAVGATGIVAPPLTKTPSDGGGSVSGTGISAPPLIKTPSHGGKSTDPTPAKPTRPTTPTTPEQTPPPTSPKRPPPAPDPLDSYVVTLVLGKTGTQRDRETVERLTPLPSGTTPFLAYVGVLPDEKTAVFLLSSDVKASGEGACKPRTSSCETVELRRGDTEYFAVTGDDGTVTWYQLDFGHVVKKKTDAPSPAAAARAAAKTSGAQASAADDLGSDRYAYHEGTGLLTRVKGSADLGAAVPSSERARRAILRGFGAAEEPAGPPEFLPGSAAAPGR